MEPQGAPTSEKNLYVSFTGTPYPTTQRCTRSGIYGGRSIDDAGWPGVSAGKRVGNANTVVYRGRTVATLLNTVNVEAGRASLESPKMDDAIPQKAAS